MWLCGLDALTTSVRRAFGIPGTSNNTSRRQRSSAGEQNLAPEGRQTENEVVAGASMITHNEESDRRRSAQERAQKQIEDYSRQEAAAAKHRIDSFLTRHHYSGVNRRRSHMIASSWKYPLHTAVKHGDAHMVTLLLRARADPYVWDSRGRTPEDLARSIGNERVLGALERWTF